MSQPVNLTLPTSRQPVTDGAGFMTIPWYRYFQNSQSTNNNFVSIPSGTILGNDSGSQGVASAIGIGSGLSLSNGVLSAVSSFSGTTDNVPEGTHNLYFTNLRAQDAIGQILANDSNITFSYARGASITANLTTITPTTGGTLQATAFDTYGRINKTQAITWATAGSVAMAYNSSTNTVSASLNTTGVSEGTYGSATQSAVITVNAQGQITAASNTNVTPAWSSITSTPTTLAGYGITNGVTTSTQVIAGTGLAGGGALTGNVTLTLASQAASTLLGNPSTSSGIPSAITIGSGLDLSTGGVLSATGGGGSVTSVGLSLPSQFTVTGSPVTGSGTLTGTWNSQSANLIFAGPSSGASAAPTFRSMVTGDLPSNIEVSGHIYANYSSGTPGSTGAVELGDPTGSSSSRVVITAGGQPTSYIAFDCFGEQLRLFGSYRGGSANVFGTITLNGGAIQWNEATTISTGTNNSALTASTSGSATSIVISDTGSNGANLKFIGNGSTTPNKTIRANSGQLQIINSAYSASIVTIDDSGNASFSGNVSGTYGIWSASNWGQLTGMGTSGTVYLWGTNGSGDNICSMTRAGSSSYNLTWNGAISGQAISGTTGTFSGNINANSGLVQSTSTTFSWGLNGGTKVSIQSGVFIPATDNSITCGSNSARWSAVWAVNGTIQTSDGRDKSPLQNLIEAEIRVANRILEAIGIYRWLKDLEALGDDALWHFGAIAQIVCKAFEEEGLRWQHYGMITYEDDRYGINYAELNAFLSAGLHSRLKRIESVIGL